MRYPKSFLKRCYDLTGIIPGKDLSFMYILKNACKSITRSSGRNILIGIIVIVIAVSSSVALSIKRAASKAEETGLADLQVTAQISVDRQAMMEQARSAGGDIREAMQNTTDLSLDELEKYAASDSVKDFYFTLSSSINASGDLSAVDTSDSSTESSSTAAANPFGDRGGPQGGMGDQGDFTITGYSSDTAMTSFVNGTSVISDGEMFDEGTADRVCVISNELALLNSLAVGDSIVLANPNTQDETYTFTIVGIYTSTAAASSAGGMSFSTSTDPANQIYTSYNTLKAVTDASESVAVTSTDEDTGREQTTALRSRLSSTYVLGDAAGYEAFKSDTAAMGLTSPYTVSSNDISNYESSLVPLQNLSKFASTFVLVVLLIGGIILVAFNIFNIRERKYEVGVLTAIGMKKTKVAAQFISELFLVTIIAIFIGTSVGAVMSVPVAGKLLESQITAQQEEATQTQQNFGRPDRPGGTPSVSGSNAARTPPAGFGGRVVNYVSDINASTDLVVVGELIGIGILLTLLSSCAAIIFIMRYEPLKILSERS